MTRGYIPSPFLIAISVVVTAVFTASLPAEPTDAERRATAEARATYIADRCAPHGGLGDIHYEPIHFSPGWYHIKCADGASFSISSDQSKSYDIF